VTTDRVHTVRAQVVEILTESPHPLTAAVIGDLLTVIASGTTLERALTDLVNEGFAAEDDGRYSLTEPVTVPR
jgi:DNA-binding IclR family transcriptional regulator